MNINTVVRLGVMCWVLVALSGFEVMAKSQCQHASQGLNIDERIVRCGATMSPESVSEASRFKDWLELADLYRQAGDTQRSGDILQKLASQVWAEAPDTAFDIAFAQGVNGYFSRDYSQSFSSFRLAYEHAQLLESPSKLARVYNALANLSQVRSDYDSMVRLLELASSHYRRLGDTRGLARVYNNLGNAYRFTHRHNLAISTYRRALQLHNQAGDVAREAHTQVNMARSMIQMGQSDKAHRLLNMSLDQFAAIGALQRQIEVNGLLASIEMESSRLDSAAEYLSRNLSLKAQLDGHFFDAGSEMVQARYYLVTGQSQLAEALIKQGIEQTRQQGNQIHLKGYVKLLAEFYADGNNQAMVNQYLKQHAKLLSDELAQKHKNFGQLSDIFYRETNGGVTEEQPMSAAQLLALADGYQAHWSWLALMLGSGLWCWRQVGRTRVQTAIRCASETKSREQGSDESELAVTEAPADVGRQKLVELMLLAIQLWEQETQTDRLELADRSKIWNVSQDDGRLRVRAMDRYMSMDKLPSQPRWRSVVRTCYFVLNHCSSASPLQQELSQCLSHFLEWEKQKATSI